MSINAIKSSEVSLETRGSSQMSSYLRPIAAALVMGLGWGSINPTPAEAYQVDCAILLCLSGGWPASAPCAHARAVFIERITPWPIEPPLQIWRCPMGAAFRGLGENAEWSALIDALYREPPALPMSTAPDNLLHEVQATDGADIDISGREFDFVRSIRVFDVQYSQRRNRDGDCITSDRARLGSYGEQGEYAWARTTTAAVPPASEFEPPSGCGSYSYRSVFVDWRDYQGTYGSEEVRY